MALSCQIHVIFCQMLQIRSRGCLQYYGVVKKNQDGRKFCKSAVKDDKSGSRNGRIIVRFEI